MQKDLDRNRDLVYLLAAMKNIVYCYATNSILAVTGKEDDAHFVAECLSYRANGNSIYGLFKIALLNRKTLRETELGRQAIINWHNQCTEKEGA